MNLRAFSGAALLASVTLVVPAAVAHAAPASPKAPAATAAGSTTSGHGDGFSRTATPTQTRTSARVAGSDPVAAARTFLADRRSTYHIATADLRTVSKATERGLTTVRFGQSYRGLPVAGAQYVVRLKDSGSSNQVAGTSGQYFSDLTVDTSHPLGFALAKAAALHALSAVRWDRTPTVEDGGTTIVPTGKGVLTRHVTVTGYDLGRRKAVRQEMYIHAHTGKPVLSFNNIQTDGPVDTTGPSVNGGSVPLAAFQGSAGFQLRDHSRAMFAAHGGEILTRDAAGEDLFQFIDEELPPRLQPVTSPTIPFPASPKSGANDAHWALGQVYEFYRGLGRDSIDGQGGTINAVVGVTDFGSPFPNAFWNGAYMVFGTGGFGFKPFSASLDVVGHELTHGVIDSSSPLMYLGQSGATNEAAADYLGNAVQNTVESIPEDSPLDGLLGDQLCKRGPRADCFFRDMNQLTTTDDFISTPDDNGGVHLNSTIISGSWWQIRHALTPAVADPLIYKTVTQGYLSPLAQFLDVRDATISAAVDSGLSTADVEKVAQAFIDHGIVDNWESTRLGVDFHALHAILGFPFIYPRVADGSWYASDLASPTDTFPAILTNSLDADAAAEPTRLSPDDSAYYDNPDSDGGTAVWSRTRDTDGRTYIQSKDLTTGVVTTEDFIEFPFVFNVRVSGKTIVYTTPDFATDGQAIAVLRPDGTKVILRTARGRYATSPDVLGTQVVYAVVNFSGRVIRIRSYDSVTGDNTLLATMRNRRRMSFADLSLTPQHVVFSLDRTLRTARTGIITMDRDGANRHRLLREDSSSAPRLPMMTATDEAVSFVDYDIFSEFFDARLRQMPTSGGSVTDLSCSRAYKGAPASDSGTGVAWVDFSAGKSQIVNRTEPPAVACG